MNAYLCCDRTISSFPVSGYASVSAERSAYCAPLGVGECLWHALDLP